MRDYIVVLIIFLAGWFANSIYGDLFTFEETPKNIDNIEEIAPGDHFQEQDVEVYNDKVILNLPYKGKEYSWSRYADTGSMKRTFDNKHNGIEILNPDIKDIKEGDIISYRLDTEIIVHRVVRIGSDNKGWYAITKGDANQQADPYLVRENQVEALTIAIIY